MFSFDSDSFTIVCNNSANVSICNDQNMFVGNLLETSGHTVATIWWKGSSPVRIRHSKMVLDWWHGCHSLSSSQGCTFLSTVSNQHFEHYLICLSAWWSRWHWNQYKNDSILFLLGSREAFANNTSFIIKSLWTSHQQRIFSLAIIPHACLKSGQYINFHRAQLLLYSYRWRCLQ